MKLLFLLGCLIGSYLLGSFNASIIFSKLRGTDIRNEGSKNAGMTNALRVFGKKAAAFVFLFDLLKAVISVLLAKIFTNSIFPGSGNLILYAQYLAGLGAVVGHNYPLYFKFRGGKGILASWGAIIMLDWRIGLLLLLVFILVVAATRYVSLASVTSAILYPLFVIAFNVYKQDLVTLVYITLSLVVSVLAVFRHRANIARLRAGTESKLGQKKES